MTSDGPPPARRPRRRGRPPVASRPPPGPCTPCSPTSPPTSPGSSGSSASTLVDRSNGRLTEEGEVVVARARRIQAELEALVADVASARTTSPAPSASASSAPTGRWLVPRCSRPSPSATPASRSSSSTPPPPRSSPRCSTGASTSPSSTCPSTSPTSPTEPLFDEDLVLVAPEPPARPRRTGRPLAELARPRAPARAAGHRLPRRPRRRPRPGPASTLRAQAEVDGMRLLASLAFAGFGAAVLPATAAPHRSPRRPFGTASPSRA